MKKKLAALLCAMALTVPALCVSEMSDTVYTCDACKYAGSFLMVVTGTETREGFPGEWITVQCPQCGEPYTSYWRTTGDAVAPAGTEPQENPAPAPAAPEAPAVPPQEPSADTPASPAEPEAPAAPPQESSPDTPAGGSEPAPAEPAVVLLPENQQPSGPQAAETMPPVPAGNPDPAPANAPSGQEPPRQEAPENSGTVLTAGNPSGDPAAGARRNILKYPYFSAAYPSRRLNLEGDPDALAPIPGLAVYPEPAAEGSSILRHMLDGN